LYLQRLKEEISTLREEKALLNEINDIDVIDAFEVPTKKKDKPMKTNIGRGNHYAFKIDDMNSTLADDFFNWKTNGSGTWKANTGTVDIDRMNISNS
jgi:hypothetical protein